MSDKTLRELQISLPWIDHYHRDFRASPQTHKNFAHGLLHTHKVGGGLASIIDEAEHGGYNWADPVKRAEVEKYVADLVICALRLATTCPDGQIDLQRAVENRLAAKNNQRTIERDGTRLIAYCVDGCKRESNGIDGLCAQCRAAYGESERHQ